MRVKGNLGNRLMAVFLSVAMVLVPMLPESGAWAAELETGAEYVGVMPDEGEELSESGGAAKEDLSDGVTADGNDVRFYSARLAADFSKVGGWNECIYAEIEDVSDGDVKAVSYSGAMEGSLSGNDFDYLVRDMEGGVRIDIPGLKAGTYTLSVTVGETQIQKEGIKVYAYDRSGYAHFNYQEGVGAYNNDGTLKENARVIYVTDENKNTLEVTAGGRTVTGIGNILNKTSSKNQSIMEKFGVPVVFRFIGTVSDSGLYESAEFDATKESQIEGLIPYSAVTNKETNGHMAGIVDGKNLTLEGIGADAVIDGWGFSFAANDKNNGNGVSFEVRNLKFINTPEDAIGMEGKQASDSVDSDLAPSVERCWVHNNSFYRPNIKNPSESDKAQGDGSVDFKKGQYFTCSYNYFEGCHKTHLVGGGDKHIQYNITYHHNYYKDCESRGPLARNANIHSYNNWYEDQTSTVQDARANAFIFSEYNRFDNCKNPQQVKDGAVIKSYQDSLTNCTGTSSMAVKVEDRTKEVDNNCQFKAREIDYSKFELDESQSYIPNNDYILETDMEKLKILLKTQTGVLNPESTGQIEDVEQEPTPEPVKYKVTLDTDGGILKDNGETGLEVEENTMLTPGDCQKEGYTFIGWTVDGEAVETPYKVTGPVTLKAAYTKDEDNGDGNDGEGSGGDSGYVSGDGDDEKRTGIYIIGLEETYDYTGAKIVPNIGVADYDITGGKLLSPGVDYTVSYQNNKNPGKAIVTVKGKGNYAGRDVSKTFRIVEVAKITTNLADLKGAKLAKIDAVPYTGDAQYPKLTLTLKGGAPTEYTYNKTSGVYEAGGKAINANVALSNNINKGTATILITGAADGKGKPTKIKKTFKITAIDLAKKAGKVSVTVKAGVYNLKGAKPASITVSYDGKTLRNGTDYTVKYSANKKATSGGAKFTVTGKGNYAKTYKGSYTIVQLDMKELKVDAVTAYTDMAAGKVKATVRDAEGNILKASQYTISVYKDAEGKSLYDTKDKLKAGRIYVKASAKDTTNLKGETSLAEFSVGVNIAKANIALTKTGGKTLTKTYTGNAVTLEAKDLTVTIKEDGTTKTLTLNNEFEIAAYSNNVGKGTATAVLKGIGNYSGTKTVKFKIVGKPIKFESQTAWDKVSGLIKSFKKH
ncbi:MAG: hypothetical protein NC092_10225 [Butyrivibrio sp.]|nr:hypothetical protein [Butyrivibrio sp.]